MENGVNSELLKGHTEKVHVQLEQMLIPVIQNIQTRSHYAELLKIFYAFYAPVEDQLNRVRGIESFTEGINIRKAASLKSDIVALEEVVDQLPLCTELPQCVNVSQALGIMYVLEGSVLGGKAIASIVTRRLPADIEIPFSFFLHYNGEAKLKWEHFKMRLDSMEGLPKPDLLSAAADTFILFKNWIAKNVRPELKSIQSGNR